MTAEHVVKAVDQLLAQPSADAAVELLRHGRKRDVPGDRERIDPLERGGVGVHVVRVVRAGQLELVEAEPGGGDVGQATGCREPQRGRRAAVGGSDGQSAAVALPAAWYRARHPIDKRSRRRSQ